MHPLVGRILGLHLTDFLVIIGWQDNENGISHEWSYSFRCGGTCVASATPGTTGDRLAPLGSAYSIGSISVLHWLDCVEART